MAKGFCQWCGESHKMEDGLLSTHGHNRLHSGGTASIVCVCAGSHHPHLEVSCDEVKQSIAWFQDKYMERQAQIPELQSYPDSPRVWYRHHTNTRSYQWKLVELISLTHYQIDGMVWELEGVWDYCGDNILELAWLLNQQRVRSIKMGLSQIGQYIYSQQIIVDSWIPGLHKPQ